MYIFMVISMVFGAVGLFSHTEFVKGGKADTRHTGNFLGRSLDLIRDVIFQSKTIQSPTPGVAHTFVYLGFLALLFATTVVFLSLIHI